MKNGDLNSKDLLPCHSPLLNYSFKEIFVNMYIPNLTFIRYSFLHPQFLCGGTTVHLDQFRAVPVPSVKCRVQSCHQIAFACSKQGIDSRSIVQKDLAHVQMSVESCHVQRCFAIVCGHVQSAWTFFRQPLDQLDSTGSDGFVGNTGPTYRPRVKRATVLSKYLQSLQLTFGCCAKCWSEIFSLNLDFGFYMHISGNGNF